MAIWKWEKKEKKKKKKYSEVNFPEATACLSVANEIGFVKSIAPRNVHTVVPASFHQRIYNPTCESFQTWQPTVAGQYVRGKKRLQRELFVKNISHVIKPYRGFFFLSSTAISVLITFANNFHRRWSCSRLKIHRLCMYHRYIGIAGIIIERFWCCAAKCRWVPIYRQNCCVFISSH